ncbi:MAG: ssDNA endodeoxyribonuclease [Caeruleum heppii]|nr:MAG: ssDNA endodeoxyribonuclease [Caeruleum heppii]
MPPSRDPITTTSFSAVSGSARQLFLLLRCISFAPKVQVQITKEGLRFTVEENRVMQGLAFLERTLFTTYCYTAPPEDLSDPSDSLPTPSTFQISLPALLETLQIFGQDSGANPARTSTSSYYNSGLTSNLSRDGGLSGAFDPRVLGMTGVCRLSYGGDGTPLTIHLDEAGVSTTCHLTTYEPDGLGALGYEEIPLQRDKLVQKIIMRAGWLHDAITELSSTSPTRLTMTASPSGPPPHFSLSATGPLGSATVDFSRDDPHLLETFQVAHRCSNTYKFSLVRAASRAMALASKVSIRLDEVGVLSLQFMVEVDGLIGGMGGGGVGGGGGGGAGGGGGGGGGATGGVSFVDFRVVPYVRGLGEDGEDVDEEDDEEGG